MSTEHLQTAETANFKNNKVTTGVHCQITHCLLHNEQKSCRHFRGNKKMMLVKLDVVRIVFLSFLLKSDTSNDLDNHQITAL
jgi:hypothetical protein